MWGELMPPGSSVLVLFVSKIMASCWKMMNNIRGGALHYICWSSEPLSIYSNAS